jgi:hypothetical protein
MGLAVPGKKARVFKEPALLACSKEACKELGRERLLHVLNLTAKARRREDHFGGCQLGVRGDSDQKTLRGFAVRI